MIGEEAREVYATFNDWENDGDDKKIKPVLKKFGEYCEPRGNIPFERFKFNRRMQEPEETTTSTSRPCESLPIATIRGNKKLFSAYTRTIFDCVVCKLTIFWQ